MQQDDQGYNPYGYDLSWEGDPGAYTVEDESFLNDSNSPTQGTGHHFDISLSTGPSADIQPYMLPGYASGTTPSGHDNQRFQKGGLYLNKRQWNWLYK
ncbi:hypothetical protein CORC01_04841 [Colletotrichum orchidophilum]|uniref:Uncharacterized protein n=1 Tax=Colletotrichum orchidophilum TaxID=1209926 RepID=A0A1G4BEZ3_9PEZI|nr:uncharacterized protein CORC01_04841 [Colletotrichum orchidophilum]OHE99940.1 hypothetical protein CORC01_04841 [Colletotrichum orchidophilum]